jgi:DNA-binding NtrC family response regulator
MATDRPLRVLVIDDEQPIADSLVTIFRNNGFDATSVYSGYSAIEAARSVHPDVVISDVRMPGVNGLDAILSIWRRLPSAKFILCSGQADYTDRLSMAREQGFSFVYLHKPIPPQSFIEYLKDWAQERAVGAAG